MQPNGNTPGAARPVAGAPVNNVNTVPTSMPTPKPEPAFGNGESVVEGKGNKKAGWILAIVFLLIVAAGGVGFGVWAMMDGNAQKDALNSQISALKQQNSELQGKLDNGGDTIINVDADGNEVNTADYIYVGEWGLKIRIPEGLNKVSYAFKQNGGLDRVEGSTVTVSGTVGDNLSDFANMYKNNSPLGAINRILKGAYGDGLDCQYSSLVFSDDDYNYCYEHPQSVYSTSQEEQDLEVKTADLIEQMLNNAENYSKI